MESVCTIMIESALSVPVSLDLFVNTFYKLAKCSLDQKLLGKDDFLNRISRRKSHKSAFIPRNCQSHHDTLMNDFIYFSVRHSDQTHPSAHPPCSELLTANIIVCIPIINGKMIIWLRWALLINSSANQFKWIFSIGKDNDLVFNENQTNPKYQSSFPLHCIFFHCIDGGRTIGNRKMHRLLFDTDEVDHVK